VEAATQTKWRAIQIPAGEYPIGDDVIPNATPRHRRSLQTFWIDAEPVSWGHVELFIAAGGFADEMLWVGQEANALPDWRPVSVDAHHRLLLNSIRATDRTDSRPLRERPVTGLTWYEASALAQFFGARLPFEVEWEAAMNVAASTAGRDSRHTSYVGRLQEWTADGFTPRYWRADFDRVGVPWVAGGPAHVVVRGAAPEDLYHHVCFRFGADPASRHPHRGLRRAWDAEPTETQLFGGWRC
jgi:formylglycine-generating enzyme required for sulfatase activity